MPAWIILLIVIAWVFSMLLAVCIGWATDVLTNPEPHPDDGEGWRSRPIKYAICGALHGHRGTTESVSKEQRCERCGKTRRVRA